MTYLAIGATTRAMVELLKRKLNKPPLLGSGLTLEVTTLPPDDDRLGNDTGVNLYLYRIVESPFLRNDGVGMPRSRGAPRPPLSVTLNYILTGYAKKVANSMVDEIIAHQVLGNAMSILHEHSVLNDVHDSDFDADLDAHFPAELRESFEKLKVTLVATSMDEFSKIWTGLSKAYRLSVAYEVSLVQIASVAVASVPAPPPQRALVGVEAMALPSIGRVDPPSGPVGTQVTLRGSGFTSRAGLPKVIFGAGEIPSSELVSVDETEIVFTVPENAGPGPRVSVAVEIQGRRSAAGQFVVDPWLGGLVPLRGPTSVPLRIAFEVPPAETVSATIDGIAAAVSVDAATKTVLATVPASITTNGTKSVVLTSTGVTPRRSNALAYEVLPRITGVTLTTSVTPVTTTVVVHGQRLAGSDVVVRYAGVLARKADNIDNANVQVVYERSLPAGAPVSVLVDGRESSIFPPRVERLEPPTAAAGDLLRIRGQGLSGASVAIQFGATTVALGAQAFSHELTVAIPSSIAPGTVNVRATVDGTDTNSMPLGLSA